MELTVTYSSYSWITASVQFQVMVQERAQLNTIEGALTLEAPVMVDTDLGKQVLECQLGDSESFLLEFANSLALSK